MKFIGKFFLTLLLLILLVLVVMYVLLQTSWGADWTSRWISDRTDYHLSVAKVEHDFSSPSHLILSDVTFGHDGQPAVLVAKRVDLGFTLAQFSDPLQFDSVELSGGALNVSDSSVAWPLQARRLQLSDMAIDSPHSVLPISAQRVNGGVMPWQPGVGNVLGNNASFQLSASTMVLNGVPGSNVLLQGRIDNQRLVFSNVGADLARGSMTGNAERDAQGNWRIANLRLNDVRLQSAQSLTDFLQPLLNLPSVQFERVDVTDARLQGPDWAVTDLDLSLKDLTLRNGDWESNGGSLSMNASSFINGQLELNDPIVNMDFTPEGINISQFSSRWVNGLIRTKGQWLRSNKRLTLDELVVAGLEYTLPTNWRDRWMQQLPGWLDSVAVTRFAANRNLVIDINPAFPFQMTALDGNGSNLLMARDHQWGIWAGALNFNAAEATFNRTDLRHPSLALTADSNQINVTEMSAFAGEGMLESLATVSQQPARALSLTLNGRGVATGLLHNWGWPAVPLPGTGSLQLKLDASLAAATPLRQSASGTLSVNANDQSVQQHLVNGELRP
ncbi:AsmA family protein [Pantoea sp. B65]|uniref:AsmA family protein n=1 Tax=Pantoea sp. B65 TaxID=2813359 RepID=UPI0039B3D06C